MAFMQGLLGMLASPQMSAFGRGLLSQSAGGGAPGSTNVASLLSAGFNSAEKQRQQMLEEEQLRQRMQLMQAQQGNVAADTAFREAQTAGYGDKQAQELALNQAQQRQYEAAAAKASQEVAANQELSALIASGRYTPQQAAGLLARGGNAQQAFGLLKSPEAFTLKPGEIRYDASGKRIAEGGEATENLTPQERHLRAAGLTPGTPEYQKAIKVKALAPSAEQAKTQGVVTTGLDLTDQLEQGFKSGKFTTGVFGTTNAADKVPRLMQTESAKQFADMRQNLGDAIVRLRSGANAPEAEVQRFLSLLPRTGDGDAVVLGKLRQIKNEFKRVDKILSGDLTWDSPPPAATTAEKPQYNRQQLLNEVARRKKLGLM